MIVLLSFGVAFASSVLALLYAYWLTARINAQSAGSAKMQEIASAIRQGAMAYLNRQYRTLAIFVVLISIALATLLYYTGSTQQVIITTVITFILGAILSAIAGYAGMIVSVRANVRTAEAAKHGLKPAFKTAFMGGTVTGMAVVGLGLLGITGLYYFTGEPKLLLGFGFGASLISLFARVGGGIYTKGADVGADLVGKVEKGIPEDDPRNPAVIADNVGDNVGDCAGMAADLFESYTVTLLATMILAVSLGPQYRDLAIAFPLMVSGVAIIASIIGSLLVDVKNEKDIWPALNRGIWISAFLTSASTFLISYYIFDSINLFYAALVGIVVTLVIGWITEYYTSTEKKPVKDIAESAKTGPATTIISGLAIGMQSTLVPIIIIVAGIFAAYLVGGGGASGIYAISIAALSMLSMTGIIVAVDAYGPITDNAGGIAEMSKLPKKVRDITDPLDAVGNTTKAVTKGFAIGSAALAALSLFVAFGEEVGLTVVNIYDPRVVIGLFIGGLLPFLFGSMTMSAVGRAAFDMVNEVRRQFRTNKGIMKGTSKPDYARCVDISTRAAIRELMLPGIMAVAAPLLVGFIFGVEALAGLLAGSIVTGLLLGITMTTSGAAWDNAKKYVEKGNLGGKGSDAHKATVVGDTVGDPFKDTVGPSMNPLIKVLNTVSILFASLLVTYGGILGSKLMLG